MARTIHKTNNPVTLEGFQAVLEPSKFGYSLAAIVDDSIVNENKRQSPLTKVKVEAWIDQQPIELPDQSTIENYNRNEKLVDLTKVPENLTEQIKVAYDNSVPNSRTKIFGYMMEHRLKNLLEHLEEF